jgi:hypothetical protein
MEKIREGVGRRYLEAPRMSSQESYGDMVDFVNYPTLSHGASYFSDGAVQVEAGELVKEVVALVH